MISSMTGFGRGTATDGDTTVTVELKSVNSRFCEVSLRVPRSLADKEIEMQNVVKQAIARGRVSVFVQIDRDARLEAAVTPNMPAATAYRGALQKLAESLGLNDDVRLDHLLRFPEVIEKSDNNESDADTAWPVVQKALDDALDELTAMRRREGDALLADLSARIDAIEARLGNVNERAPVRVELSRERLRERLAEVMDEARIDAERLEFEIALLADKLDVNEEAVRLASHLEMFREALVTHEPVGRKLNFIAQEINREINTIGSKSNDAELAHTVVEMKEELEKLREQIENVQ